MAPASDSTTDTAGEEVPTNIAPMLASVGAPPRDDAEWAFEAKWDGVRAIAFIDGGRLRLASRNGNDFTASYPEVAPLGAAFGGVQAVLDGEIIATAEGRPSFAALQRRIHVSDPAEVGRLVGDAPVSYLAFDVLYLGGSSLLKVPYAQRRRLLEGLDLDGPAWSTPPSWTGVSLEQICGATQESGLEGVVAKSLSSRYHPGVRSDAWRKFKHQHDQEFVVGGWTSGQGVRAGDLGALLLGYYEQGRLRYAGKVGTGFSRAARALLLERLATRAREGSPFEEVVPNRGEVHWVEPEVVVEVEFTEWTPNDHVRHPTFRGLRVDKLATDVRRT